LTPPPLQRTEHLKRHIEVHHENDLFDDETDDYITRRFRKDEIKLDQISREIRQMHAGNKEMIEYFTKNRVSNRWMQLRRKGN
ncbi:hypothetical protein TrRE_jg9139, partial [Triparma retinervis]